MNKGIVVIKVGKKPSAGRVESITTVMNNFNLSESELQSLIDKGDSFTFGDETYFFDEYIDD